MKKESGSVLVACLAAGWLANASAEDAGQPARGVSEAAGVAVVEVPVVVTAKDGSFVPDLRAEDFVVKDNGEKQKLLFAMRVDATKTGTGGDEAGMAGADQGAARPLSLARNFVLLFDLTFNDPPSLQLARRAAIDFISNQLAADDYAAVFTLDSNAGVNLLMNFTKDRAQLRDAIITFGSNKNPSSLADSAGLVRLATGDQARLLQAQPSFASSTEGFVLGSDESNPNARRDIKRADISQYRGAIGGYLIGLKSFASGIDVIAGRKIVVFFSRGFDTKALGGTTLKEASAQAESFTQGDWESLDATTMEVDTRNIDLLDQVVSALTSADCRVFCVDPSGTRVQVSGDAGAGDTSTRTHAALETLSNETGGAVFRNTNDLAGAMQKIAEATSSYYLLAYNAPPGGKGRFHKIDVDVMRADVKFTHRKGYVEVKPFLQFSPLEKQVQIASLVAGGRAPGGAELTCAAVPFPACQSKAGAGTQRPGRCAVVFELSADTLARLDVAQSKDFDVYAFAVAPATGEISGYLHGVARIKDPKKAAGLRYADVMDLAPGSFEIRGVVRNPQTGATATGASKLAMKGSEGFKVAACYVSEKSAWENATSKDVTGECYPLTFKGTVLPVLAVARAAAGGDVSLVLKAFDLQLDAAGKPELDVIWFLSTPEGLTVPIASYKFLQGDWPTKTEYDMLFKVTLPAQLRPGAYQLGIRATDKLRGSSESVLLPFQVGS